MHPVDKKIYTVGFSTFIGVFVVTLAIVEVVKPKFLLVKPPATPTTPTADKPTKPTTYGFAGPEVDHMQAIAFSALSASVAMLVAAVITRMMAK